MIAPFRSRLTFFLARSTSMRRIARAAAAKKCPRACGNNECGPSGQQSSVQFAATAGEQFLIQVAGSGLQGLSSPNGTGVLTIASEAACPADFNADGFVDPDDLADFITCFFLDAQAPGTCPGSDFNRDGFVDPDDLSDYITAFFTSPC